jgi:hypothetical protein
VSDHLDGPGAVALSGERLGGHRAERGLVEHRRRGRPVSQRERDFVDAVYSARNGLQRMSATMDTGEDVARVGRRQRLRFEEKRKTRREGKGRREWRIGGGKREIHKIQFLIHRGMADDRTKHNPGQGRQPGQPFRYPGHCCLVSSEKLILVWYRAWSWSLPVA